MGGGRGILRLPSVGVGCLVEGVFLLADWFRGVVLPEEFCFDSSDARDAERAISDRIEPFGLSWLRYSWSDEEILKGKNQKYFTSFLL